MEVISYKKKKENLQNDILEVTKELLKTYVISFLVLFSIGGLFLLLGFTSSPNLLNLGFLLVILGLFAFSAWIMKKSKIKKMLAFPFEKTNQNEIDYSLEIKNNEFIITNFSLREVISFNQEEIKKISFLENHIIVHLLSKDKIIFPKQQDILRVFQKII